MALSPELIRFAQGNTDYFVAFQDYYNHYNQAYQGRNLGPFNESVSLDEKAAKIQTAFFAEVERRSGVQRDANEPEAWASNPMVQWAAFAVIDATINSVLPVTINPTIGLYTDIRYAGYGDIVKYKVKPRTLYTITKGNEYSKVA